jgi:hypothetical protein
MVFSQETVDSDGGPREKRNQLGPEHGPRIADQTVTTAYKFNSPGASMEQDANGVFVTRRSFWWRWNAAFATKYQRPQSPFPLTRSDIISGSLHPDELATQFRLPTVKIYPLGACDFWSPNGCDHRGRSRLLEEGAGEELVQTPLHLHITSIGRKDAILESP